MSITNPYYITSLSDFDFQPKHTEAELTAAKNWLVNARITFGMTANFAIIGTTRGTPWVEPKVRSYCHRGINEGAVGTHHDRSLVASECGWARGTYGGNGAKVVKTREQVRPFMEYLLHQSPYAPFILTQDTEWCLDWGIVVSADIPANVMQNALIMSRYFYELGAAAFDMFNLLLSRGVNPDVAHVCAFGTAAAGGDELILTQGTYPQSNHRATMLSAPADVKRMVERRIGACYPTAFADPATFYRNQTAYLGGVLLFVEKGKDQGTSSRLVSRYQPVSFVEEAFKDKDFVEMLSEHRKAKAASETYRPPNPFAPGGKTHLAPNQFSNQEFLDAVIPWLNEYATRDIPIVKEIVREDISNAA